MTFEEIMSLKVGDFVESRVSILCGYVLEISDEPDRFGNPQRRVNFSDGRFYPKRHGELQLFAGKNASGEWQDSFWNEAKVS